jgi:hypothetical protein
LTKITSLTHEFVEFVPNELAEGVLYVSMPYATVTHKCCCGCGNEVVTPLSPTYWKLTFDGETISLNHSIGNWNFPCQSHYWIERSRVRWATRMSREQIDAGRTRDRRLKENFYAAGHEGEDASCVKTHGDGRDSLLSRLVDLLRRR